MRKAIKYLVLLVCILIYVVSCNQNLTIAFNDSKDKFIPVFESDRWKYGDLYGMSYLSFFRKNYHHVNNIKPITCTYNKNIDLYSICDSYLWGFFPSSTYYCGVDKFSMAKTNTGEQLSIMLDSSKINVLLFEISERNLRNVLSDSSFVNNLIVTKPPVLKTNSSKIILSKTQRKQNVKGHFVEVLFNRKINSNIESNIWDISLFTCIKELKADINYKLFGSIDNNVQISKDKKQLFYWPTIDTTSSMSSFKNLSIAEINILVSRLNTLYFNAKRLGFKKVYLSIIPNPVSIIEPDYKGLTYNRLLEKIQLSKKLQIPYINVFSDFNLIKRAAYSASDTHWSATGASIWLNKVNFELNKISESN